MEVENVPATVLAIFFESVDATPAKGREMLELCVSLLEANGISGGKIPAFGHSDGTSKKTEEGKGKGKGNAAASASADEDDDVDEVPVALVASVVHNALGELLLDSSSGSSNGSNNGAAVKGGRGAAAAAAASFEESLLFWPNNCSALLSLAHMDRELGKLESALARLTAVVEYTPPYVASVSSAQLSQALLDVGTETTAAESKQDEVDVKANTEAQDHDQDEEGEKVVVDDEEEEPWDWRDGLVANPHKFCLSVASYHLAHLQSRLGEHDKAAPVIASMGMKYRLAPEVWNVAHRSATDGSLPHKPRANTKSESKTTTSKLAASANAKAAVEAGGAVLASKPTVYTNAVPPAIKRALMQGFAPAAQYWEQNGYDAREYFSWWYEPSQEPSSAVERLIQHLAPLTGLDNIVGAEWWTHSREIKGDFGHQLHFDMEERTLETDGIVIHPAVSSVVYLSGAEGSAGPTLVLDQTMEDTIVAGHGWLVHPVDGAFMMFQGDLLHGVIPSKPQGGGSSSKRARTGRKRDTLSVAAAAAATAAGGGRGAGGGGGARGGRAAASSCPERRLTLMIGWWAGDDAAVAALGSVRRPHTPGPQSSVPRPTRTLSWPATLGDGSESTYSATPAEVEDCCVSLVKPAWEALQPAAQQQQQQQQVVELPTSVDQRFFIKDAADFKAAVFSEHCDT